MSTSPPAPVRRRVRKRILIPVILLALVVALFFMAYVRGTWADDEVHNPQTTAEGTVTQLYRTPAGDVQVRCASLVDAPASEVWDVIRDYANHPRFLPHVSAVEAEEKEGGRVLLRAVAHSRVWGDWPFTINVDHKQVSDTEYLANWDEPGGELKVNRGSWTVTAIGEGQTLVVLALQVDVGYPQFLVRNVLMNRLDNVVSGLRDEVHRRRAGE